MAEPRALLASLACAAVVTACGSRSVSPIGDAALQADSFVLTDILAGDIDKAHVFCEYTSKDTGAQLGFDPEDFFDVDDRSQKWETYTGIGVTYSDGSPPTVEWFDPRTVDACPDYYNPGQEIDPRAPITVERKEVQFSDGGTSEVAVLSYQ
ncbi:hypothetical protein [Corynebacterium glaucum]|uniref:hypothetical protein n=1 Tax=Corynebacterium glaucum TaxID=187491 RepID=UPI002659BB4E|nr:hypothetical protein [Corynebacterium glaucum]